MGEVVIPVVAFLVFLSALRVARTLAYDHRIPEGNAWLFGVLAWGAAASIAFFLLTIVLAVLDLVEGGGLWDWIGFISFCVSVVAVLYFTDKFFMFFDFVGMKNFWIASLFFEDPLIKKNSVFVELEREEIRAIHREQTGKDLPAFGTKRSISHTDPKKAREEIARLRAKPVERPELKEELERLKAGDTVNVTDVLQVNFFRDRSNAQYEHVRKMFVDPEERILRFQLLFPTIKSEDLQTVDRRFRLLQQIYELFDSLQEEVWLKEYEPFFDEIRVECFRVTIDSFDMPTETAFARVKMPFAELRAHAGKVYVVTEFERLKRVEWMA